MKVYIICFSANVCGIVTMVTVAASMCVLVILSINRRISLFLFYFSLRVILKVRIMPFNNRTLNYVRFCGENVILSKISPS